MARPVDRPVPPRSKSRMYDLLHPLIPWLGEPWSITMAAIVVAVSIAAATEGRGDMAMSNVVGSNIFNVGFILGGVALLRPLDTDASYRMEGRLGPSRKRGPRMASVRHRPGG